MCRKSQAGTILYGAVAGIVCLGLVGCGSLFGDKGYFRDRSLDYQKAQEYALYRLGRFEELAATNIRSSMPVPMVKLRPDHFVPQEAGIAPRPQVIDLVAQEGRFQVLRSLDKRWAWLETDAASAYLWLSQFLESQGYTMAPGSMVGFRLETHWQTVKKPSGRFWDRLKGKTFEDRYIIDFMATQDRGISGTELLVRNQVRQPDQTVDDHPDDLSAEGKTGWVEQTPSLDWWKSLASTLSEQLKLRLAESAESQLSEGFSAELSVDGNGLPQLSIDRPFAPSWEVVGQALRRLSVTDKKVVSVQDLDRSLSVYYITLNHGEGEAKDYQLHVGVGESGVLVSVQLDDNTVAPQAVSQHLLTLIKTELEAIGS